MTFFISASINIFQGASYVQIKLHTLQIPDENINNMQHNLKLASVKSQNREQVTQHENPQKVRTIKNKN